MEKILHNALRSDIGTILAFDGELDLYKGKVGGYSIEWAESETTVTSYTYKRKEDRDRDLETLNILIAKVL